MICRKSMDDCKTPGMCAPFGGCQDAAQSELVALREELVNRNEVIAMKAREVVEAQTAVSDWARKCKAAEQRNAALMILLEEALGSVYAEARRAETPFASRLHTGLADRIEAALKPTESRVSE